MFCWLEGGGGHWKGYGGSFWGTGHVLFLVRWGLDGHLLHESTELDIQV